MDDAKIIELLFNREESALNEVSNKYSGFYKGIIGEILSDAGDVEECANDVLLAVWNSIPPNSPKSLSAYVCKLARRIGIDRYRHNTRQKRNTGYTVMLSELEDSIPSNDFFDGKRDNKLRTVISDFIDELDAKTRVLFVRRYIYFESVASLAERYGMNENRVSVILFRARKKLKKILEKEGIDI